MTGRQSKAVKWHRQQASPAIWLCCLCCLHVGTTHAAPPQYEPTKWNRSCNYTVTGVPAAVFFNRSIDTADVAFPISPGYRIPVPDDERNYLSTVQLSCFGPGQRVNQTLVAAGLKMPCAYVVRPNGLVDYYEEAACDHAMRSNCYCYSLNIIDNSGYCVPGYKTVGEITVDFSTASGDPCADAMRKVQLDGGQPVTRKEVYAAQQPATGHYIALVVWPNSDFHFFRRDAEGWWSQKRGDTFVTNTYPNGSLVLDVEDSEIRGAYSQFCGYFRVDPAIHADTDSTWTYSSVPKRLAAAKELGYAVSSTRLKQPSMGWMKLDYPYLLFGLDAAVFESGDRRLPWQQSQPSMTVSEAGKKGSWRNQVSEPGQRSSGSTLLPHWVSHAQHQTTEAERDRAIRAHYESVVRRF